MSLISDVFAGGAEGVLKGVSSVIGTLKADPTEVAKLQSALASAQLELEGKLAQADAVALQAVNASMQEEAKSEHWAQWLWRPFFGFSGAAMIINNYVLYPYFAKLGMEKMDIPSEVWYTIMAVLGVTAAGRSLVQWQHGPLPKQ